MSMLMRGIHTAYLASLRGPWRRFIAAAHNPETCQRQALASLLVENRETRFGQTHGFAGIRSFEQYQDEVPVVSYDDLEPWITQVADGHARVLTAEPVRMMERSGGSSRTNKLIPYTDRLLSEFSGATNPWLYDLYTGPGQLRGTRSYWSISPASRTQQTTAGGLPIGFEDDTAYFGPVARWALRRMMTVPGSVARLPDMTTWRDHTAQYLLAAEDLGFISVWSPSFLTLIMEHMEAHLDRLLASVGGERARHIARSVDGAGKLRGDQIWPRLGVISCWTDGPAAQGVTAIRAAFPAVHIQPKGLLATEGVVSVPVWGHEGCPLAVTSHVLEFIDLAAPDQRPLLAHQLEPGATYSPILSTGGGLYRYHLKDVVRCVGRFHHTPCIRFEGKLDCTSDMRGEKIHVRQVDEGLAKARRAGAPEIRFALLAPIQPEDDATPYYQLFAEPEEATTDEALRGLGDHLEAHLCTGHHYQYWRDLGQLGPIRVRRVSGGYKTYQRTLVAGGQRLGNVKPSHLDPRPGWAKAFGPTGELD